LVRVVVLMAALGGARRVRLGELAIRGVAVLALVLEVLAFQDELLDLALGVVGERVVVIELHGVPRAAGVAREARVTERALVQRVLVALAVRVAVRLEIRERRQVLLVAPGVA